MGESKSGNEAVRMETDSLGEVAVPARAYYGAQTQRAVENFPISGRKPDRAYIWASAAIKHAAADTLVQLGLLQRKKGEAIAVAAREVMDGKWDAHCVVDAFQAGAGTSHHMNINEVIANRATVILGGEPGDYHIHPNDDVNRAQSTNDVIPTAIRLGVLQKAPGLLQVVDQLASVFEEKALAFDGVLKSGRTHLQDAVPMRLGQEFKGYAGAIRSDADRLREALIPLRVIGIGGTAAGTGLNAPAGFAENVVTRLSSLTGFPLELTGNHFESMQSMADFAAFSGSMRVLAGTLGRIANDVRLLASGPATGLHEIELPAVQPGSSIMPGKVNPVMAEMLNMAMIHVMGCDMAVSLAAQAGQLELNVMMPVIAFELFDMMTISEHAIAAFTTKCAMGIEANAELAAFWLLRNPVIATALTRLIGYEQVAALVQKAYQTGKSIHEIVRLRAEHGDLIRRDDSRPLTVEEALAAMDDLRSLTGA